MGRGREAPTPRAPRRPHRRARVLRDRLDDPGPRAAGQVVPMASIVIRRAPGIAFAVARPPDGATSLSLRPVDDERRRRDPREVVRAVAGGDDRRELAAGRPGRVAVVARARQLAQVVLVARRPGDPIAREHAPGARRRPRARAARASSTGTSRAPAGRSSRAPVLDMIDVSEQHRSGCRTRSSGRSSRPSMRRRRAPRRAEASSSPTASSAMSASV